MVQKRKKIKIGFAVPRLKEWMGYLVYLKNLLHALSTLDDGELKPVVFIGTKADEQIVNMFSPNAGIVKDRIFDRNTVSYYINRGINDYLGAGGIFRMLMEKHDIDVVSHSEIVTGKNPYTVVNWIPDFQHIHLPGMFSSEIIRKRNAQFRKMIAVANMIIVSSHDALKDLKVYAPEAVDKARVLQFVSQPDPRIFDQSSGSDVLLRHNIPKKFCYLPNQFWKHKNHMVVLHALNLLKEENKHPIVVCTGLMDDRRNNDHVAALLEYTRTNGLEENVRFLGLVDYRDVLFFMRNAVSIINPSLFEGWSTTVEEAKSIGKNMVLSDIPVHREQAPPDSVYFDPADPADLAEKLWERWTTRPGGPDAALEREAAGRLTGRTEAFGRQYREIILEACGYGAMTKNPGGRAEIR